MTKSLRIGYVPLTDAALLHVAKAQHFAAARGLEIELVADSSWANIRDKLVAGHFDAAHMLAPAAIAVSAWRSHGGATLRKNFLRQRARSLAEARV